MAPPPQKECPVDGCTYKTPATYKTPEDKESDPAQRPPVMRNVAGVERLDTGPEHPEKSENKSARRIKTNVTIAPR